MKSNYSNGNIFKDVKIEKFPRHKFNLGHFNKFTCNHGKLVPFLVDDVIPGDRIDCKTFGRVQLQPLATSSMQNIKCYFRYFYIPYRLVWENWDKFITQENLADETTFSVPYTTLKGLDMNRYAEIPGSLMDFLGVNLTNYDGGSLVLYDDSARLSFNLFRFLAYWLVYDYYFRDENLQEPILDGPLETNGYHDARRFDLSSLMQIAYEKDYFTTALPWQQKGEPVNLSAYVHSAMLEGSGTLNIPSLDVSYSSTLATGLSLEQRAIQQQTGYDVSLGLFLPETDVQPDGPIRTSTDIKDVLVNVGVPMPENTISTSFNINDLRYSNALQKFLERKALGGTRPAEFYLSMYGVRVDDLRIGQPLYLGGGFSNVSITDVASTVDQADIPQGTLAGNGKTFPAVSFNNPYYCQEFGIVLGLAYIRPEMNYMQGLCKEMQLFKPLDFYNPIFAHLGEEAVLKSELVLKKDINNSPEDEHYNDDTFGYQSRYAYKKWKRNEIHGDLKTTLNTWVLSPYQPQNVELNDEFIRVDQNYNIFAVTDSSEDHYIIELYNDYEKESSMPNFVIPSL